ncbi:hypothetical protein N657DRAFT_573473 [Parathielavia appendiculata]|uniref:Polyprenal reductase n=1 Tax=Parathielavia appendiculata TaxID=2587402 RepID=A0AAN6U017_9PEZI|nr:hypothetical protein N657DRAFT_573473 [Parathielavia appendiculata]
MGQNEILKQIATTLSGVTPARWCQGFFLFAAGGVLAVAAMPRDAKALLMDYGARNAQKSPSREPSQGGSEGARLVSLLATITSWTQVPHSWFSAFYVVSLACSIFWLTQYFGNGVVLRYIATSQAAAQNTSGTSSQVALGWLMMFLQATRRVFEHVTVIKPSRSTMWVVHWLLGVFFYLVMGVSVWVEGSGAILDPARHTEDAKSLLKMAVAVPVFLLAWINQYKCHKHLAGLKKYSLPEDGMFCHYICPHYTCECLIYLSMAVATAPRGAWCNRTLLCALIFVAVNLGVTASGTRKWYAEKFGTGPIACKWNMIPFVF